MSCTILILLLLEALVLCGAKFAGKGFNENPFDRDATVSVRGILAISVILHHISQINYFHESCELFMFEKIGFLFVGLFFFFSGFGLYRSYEKKEDYLESFFGKRILSVLIPFFVMNVIYFGFSFYAYKDMIPVKRWLSLTGVVLANGQAWYVVVAIIMYLAFYFSFKKIKNRGAALGVILAVTLVQVALFIFGGHFFWWIKENGTYWWLTDTGWGDGKWWRRPVCWWFQGEWWVNSTIMFFFGIAAGMKEKKIFDCFKNFYWVKLVIVLAATVAFHCLWSDYLDGKGINYWSEFENGKPMIDHKAILWCVQTAEVVLFCFLCYMIMMKIKIQNPVSKFLGGYSLELYLMQSIPLFIFTDVFLKKGFIAVNRTKFALSVIVSTFVLALIFKFIWKSILTLLRKKSS